MSLQKLADLIFPDITVTPTDYIAKYPARQLNNQAKVTRYAPSPTGFQHIGGVFAALLSERIATQSGGVFYLRIEDTDQKREVAGAIEDTIRTMYNYGITFHEGMTGEDTSKGEYGPYRQSERENIYKAFAKDLLLKGLAYPCFATPEELAELRATQEAQKVTPGYYGEYATYRNLPTEEAIAKIEQGVPYIIRLKSPGDPQKRIHFTDLIKGETSFPENNQDVVIIKGDGLPTYHFAHVVDDALMHTTHVTRGEEWLSSLPIHVQLFEVLELPRPEYAHFPTIMKTEGGSKRKLSKRKDPESAVTYYQEQGYPVVCVIEYLLNIINSTFEEWRAANPEADYHEFPVSLDKMSKSGALFDIIKLNDVSKDIVARMPGAQVYDAYIQWAENFDSEMYDLATRYKEKTVAFLSIDKEGPKPRKDFAKWNEVREKICYLYDELFVKEAADMIELPQNLTLDQAKEIVTGYLEVYRHDSGSQEAWFEALKNYGLAIGYCANRKDYKANPESYKGMISDVAGAVRAAVTHRTNTPDLYTLMQILGETTVKERLNQFLNL